MTKIKEIYKIIFAYKFELGFIFDVGDMMQIMLITRPTALKIINELIDRKVIRRIDDNQKVRRYERIR
jgi:DNA-binding MarR family transcriptional regulator